MPKLATFKHVVIGLDHNLDLLKSSTHSQTQQFLETTLEYNLIPTITKPTRVTHNSTTLIDNILLKTENHELHQSKVIIDNISDHYPSLIVLEDFNPTKCAPHQIKRRKIGTNEINEIKARLANINWETELATKSTNEAFSMFYDKLTKIIDMVVPEKMIFESKKKLSVPWYTLGIKWCNEKEKRLYKLAKLPTASQEQKIIYESYHVELRKVKRKARQMYYQNMCQEFRHNSTKLWKLINGIAGKIQNKNELIERISVDNIQYETGPEIANEFAKHFSNIGKRYASCISEPKLHYKDYLRCIPSSNQNIFLDATTPLEIGNLIQNLPNKRSSGYDNINNLLLKDLRS